MGGKGSKNSQKTAGHRNCRSCDKDAPKSYMGSQTVYVS